MAADIRWQEPHHSGRLENNAMDAALGLSHALFTGGPVAGPAVEALHRVLQGILALRIYLVDRTGQYLLHFPVMEAGAVALDPLTAIAKCKEGTAAWSAFQSSQTLSSTELADREVTCLDWTELKLRYRDVRIVTVPIEAPEGVLGALTGAAGPEKPEQELALEVQTLAQQLAHSLTFCKCKNDLQAAVAILQRQGSQPPEGDSSERPSGSGHQSRRQRERNQVIATASQPSSRGSFSESIDIDSSKVDMQVYHPPRISMKDVNAALIPPAERYSEWISRNVHGQEQHTLASLVKRDGSPPMDMSVPIPMHANSAPPGRGARSGLTQVCTGMSCMHQLQSGCDVVDGEVPTGKQACCNVELGQTVLGQSTGLNSSGGYNTSCTSQTALGGNAACGADARRPQQVITASNCCGGKPCGVWDMLWSAEALRVDAETLPMASPTLCPDGRCGEGPSANADAVSLSGSEQISGYEPVHHRNRSSLSSEKVSSRSSLGSPGDWQEEDGSSLPPPTSSALNVRETPDGRPMFRLMCGEPGCSTAVWLRPEQLGLEPVTMEAIDLHQVDMEEVELAPVSLPGLRQRQLGSRPAPTRAPTGRAAALQQAQASWLAQRSATPSAQAQQARPWQQRGTPEETFHDSRPAMPSMAGAAEGIQAQGTRSMDPLSLDQRWDLSLCDPDMERRFSQRYARRLVLADSLHCALLLLAALYALGQAVLPGGHHAQAAPLLGLGFVAAAAAAAAQLVVLQWCSAAWQHREQLASAERLIMPALSLFYCLSEAPAPVHAFHAFPYAYIGGWMTLLYLAVARRLPLRAHLLLIMPELALQAAACAGNAACRHRSIGPLPSDPGALVQALAAAVLPTAAVYILEQQARWSFMLQELKRRA